LELFLLGEDDEAAGRPGRRTTPEKGLTGAMDGSTGGGCGWPVPVSMHVSIIS
jgi:hypothetical protein